MNPGKLNPEYLRDLMDGKQRLHAYEGRSFAFIDEIVLDRDMVEAALAREDAHHVRPAPFTSAGCVDWHGGEAGMSYATLDRHAREIFSQLAPDTEEQLAELEASTERMRHRHAEQMATLRRLWRDAADELEIQRKANRGLLEALRKARVTRSQNR